MAQYQLRALRSNLKTFYGHHLHLAERRCENLQSARGPARCKSGPAITWLVSVTIYRTEKFDVFRGRLLGNHNDFHCFFFRKTSEKSFVPYKASAAVQALKVCPVRPRVLSSWGITLLEKLRAADES